MNILKLVPAIALIMGITSISFAGTPKGEANKAATESPTEAKAKVKGLHTYWVVSRNLDGTYTLSDQETGACEDFTTSPCKITTDIDYSEFDMKAPQEKVDEQDEITILEHRDL